jgi:methylglutaconyl-CoA hydratase
MGVYQSLEIERQDEVAWIWMNRPEIHNAFDENLIRELHDALNRLQHDSEARVVVLSGRGSSFSAGADLNWMKRAAGYTPSENLRDARALAEMLRTLAELPKPTLARVHGAALGGGLGLVAACDIALASASAYFAASEVRLGLIPATIAPYVISAMGKRQAHRYFVTGERLSARRAAEIGLVHEVVEAAQLDAAVDGIIDALLAGGPAAHAAVKDLIRDVTAAQDADSLPDRTARRIAALRATPEAIEGVSAFLGKQTPRWKTRR